MPDANEGADALGPGETGRPPAYANENSHWWDASQIYGAALPVATAIRTGVDGKVISGTEGRLPLDPQGLEFIGDNELLGGIVGSHADHHSAPYSLTEEFVAVYRMHPLMPDAFTFRSVVDNSEIGT